MFQCRIREYEVEPPFGEQAVRLPGSADDESRGLLREGLSGSAARDRSALQWKQGPDLFRPAEINDSHRVGVRKASE